MKIFLSILAVSLILVSVPLKGNEKTSNNDTIADTSDTKTANTVNGQFWGLSAGTPGGIHIHLGYIGPTFGITASASIFDAIIPLEYPFKWAEELDSAEVDDDEKEEHKKMKLLYCFSAQINFLIPLYSSKNFSILFSAVSGNLHYSSDYNDYKIGLMYVGIGVNMFYKRFFFEVVAVYLKEYTGNSFFNRVPVLPSIQIGYMFRY